MNAQDIKKALFDYFRPPEWACFDELRDGNGLACSRSFDMWAINCYPSNGHRTIGVEIKVSRSDFLRELNKPVKREQIETYAMETYFACPLGMLKPDELPEKWGLMTVSEKGARIARRAVQRDQIQLDIFFFASVCRRAAEVEGHARNNAQKEIELKAWMADAEKYLREKWNSYLDEHEKQFIENARNGAIKELCGEGLRELQNLMNQELGWSYEANDIAKRLLAFYNHVKAGKHVESQISKVKKTLESALLELNKFEVGKKAAGSLLDGVEHKEWPE